MNDVDGAAASTLAELLRHPEDLDKIPALKAEFSRKKAAVDGQLRVGLREQLEVTQAGMANISDGQRTINLIKEEMMTIDKLCAEAHNMIQDFPHINLVAQTHRNFEMVEKMKQHVDSFEDRLVRLEALLRDDDDDLETQPNLLLIHHGLTELRDSRDEAMEQIKSSAEASMELVENLQLANGATLQDYFNRLDDVIDWFDDHVGSACINLIQLIQSGHNGMVVRLALVVKEEEKGDRKAKALQDAQREYKDLAARFKSIATGPKELRGYKDKFLQAIEATAQAQIGETNAKFLQDPDKLEKSVRWYFNDLNTVKLGMANLMPQKWRIFHTYVNIYHRRMHDWLLERIDDQDLLPTHMLAIIHWVDKYYAKMNKLGVPEDELAPHLIDNRGADLVREYRQLIVKAVEEWMDRMAVTDKGNFVSRNESALDTDEHGCFRTKTLGDMWRMLREQLAVASNSDRTDVAEGVIDAMFRALTSRQRMWESLADGEMTKYATSTADHEGMQALQDWLVAIANDQIACIDEGDQDGAVSYLALFERDIAPLVSPAYSVTVTAQVEALRNGYVDLGTHCIHVFVGLVFAVDFRSILAEFFTSAWYSQKRIGQIVSTFADYLADYEAVLHPSLRDILVEELADELLAHYLAAVRNKGAKFRRSEPFIDKIKDDLVAAFQFFELYPSFPDIKAKWRVVDGFVQLLSAERAAVPDVFEQFKQSYWDVNVGWVEAVLRARDDFERSMLSAVKTRAAEVSIERGPDTIMSKVK